METNTINERDDELIRKSIKNESPLYYFRSSPFTDHGEFNYNGVLSEKFFFENMFSKNDNTDTIIKDIKTTLIRRDKKTIVLYGNQGCGKTTFLHSLEKNIDNCRFIYFDFDKNTSHPLLKEYRELFSRYFYKLIISDYKTNNNFVNTNYFGWFKYHRDIFDETINAGNKICDFFDSFENTFIKSTSSNKDRFILEINELFFNQLLCLIILWHICSIGDSLDAPLVFCLDNLDVLVDQEILKDFFEEYLKFTRNIDSLISQLNSALKKEFSYNKLFTFIFCCRQYTWARIRQKRHQDFSYIRLSTQQINITDVFNKRDILTKREEHIKRNVEYYGDKFRQEISHIKEMLYDLDASKRSSHNIYDLFNGDYRQCNITFEDLVKKYPLIIDEYFDVKKNSTKIGLNGARGIIYRALFNYFMCEGLFNKIGVLDISNSFPLVSDARMILTYIDKNTYINGFIGDPPAITVRQLKNDFDGIINKSDIELYLLQMFTLGDNSSWSQLITFPYIHSDEIRLTDDTEIYIEKAGHEYLDLVSTHFEFFNTRITQKRVYNNALFSHENSNDYITKKSLFGFDEIINSVFDAVDHCCNKMSRFYDTYMASKFNSIEEYINSPFVYGNNVLHGERILHTHIRYIDKYRLYLLGRSDIEVDKRIIINEKLINHIMNYLNLGSRYPQILSNMSTSVLFPAFEHKINMIIDSRYTDFETEIDLDQND